MIAPSEMMAWPQPMPAHLEGPGQGIGALELRVRHEAGGHRAHDHVDDRADGERAEDAARHDRAAGPSSPRPRWRSRRSRCRRRTRWPRPGGCPSSRWARRAPSSRDRCRGAHADEQGEHRQLEDHHRVVHARALLDADDQHPGDDGHDHDAGDVDGDVVAEEQRQLAQALGMREDHVAVAVAEPERHSNPKTRRNDEK